MDIDEIILKELEDQLTHEDRSKLNAWLNDSPKNKKIYNQVKFILAGNGKAISCSGEDEVWDDLRKSIEANQSVITHNKKASASIKIWVKYAAIILLSLGLGAIIHQNIPQDQGIVTLEPKLIEKGSRSGQKITTKLPDGTVVKLNANSKIIIPEQFVGDTRRIELYGEAFFDVVPDKSKPFIISIGSMEVKVLGTSFNVKEDGFSRQKIVAVKTGKVTVEDKSSGELVVLNPSQMVIQNKGEGLYKKDFELGDEIFGWAENKLIFNDDDHHKVLRELGYWFGKEVIVNGEIDEHLKYTATYVDPTLEEVLLSSSHIFGFKYKIDGDKIIIE